MEKLIQPDPGLIIWTVLTFGFLLVVLRAFAWKPFLGLIEERERAIRDSLDAARRAREDAQASLQENRKLLAEARQEAGLLVQRGQREAEQVRTDVLAKARQEHEDLLRRGREDLDREKRAAIREIRGAAADLAVAAAEKLMEARLGSKEDRDLVDRYLIELEGTGER